MDLGAKFGSLLILTLFFRPLVCQQLNTDGYFVSQFFHKMGLNSSKNYNFSAPFCTWPGVVCDANKENVVKFVASGLGLSGVVADTTMGKLSKLHTLDLSDNKITGLPSDFWSLGSLKDLNLSFNAFSGSLSSNIVNFVPLESLDISYNYFTGSIPESIGSLSNLQVLKLNNNGFESSIPHGVLECKSLVSIDVSVNKLNGSVLNGFGAACPKLKYLNIAGNAISGKESDFSGLTSITYLNISGNKFKGSVVGLFQGPLRIVDLSRNQFEGHIFSSSLKLSSLVHVDLSENQLSGEPFAGLTEAHNLKHLNLAHNRFLQHELQNLDMFSGLEYLNLSETNMIGAIPLELSLLSSLRTLDLSKNHLNSSIIPLLGVFNLNVLDVSYNNLSGEIPMSLLQKLNRMERFNFSYNNLTFCGSKISHEILNSAFIGSVNSCPFAANPEFFKKEGPKHKGLKLALPLIIAIACLLVFFIFLLYVFRRRNKTSTWEVKQPPYREEQLISGPFAFQTDSTTWVADVKLASSIPVVIFEKPLTNFTFTDLLSATNHFDRGTLLAEGKFGPVYGGYLPGGIHVAIKVLVHAGSTMRNEDAAREFEYLGRLKHPNLVPLAGYCLAGEQRICIYEYMENGNLQNLLHDHLPLGFQNPDDWSTDTWEEVEGNNSTNSIQNVGSEGPLTNWRFRHKFLLGTARALAFLHHGCFPPIVHRDVKASSVYLDLSFEPRLSDFGLANFFGNVLDVVIARGSPGYMAPEFSSSSSGSKATTESDVYAFGIVLFELITGKKPVGDDYYPEEKEATTTLVGWVRSLIRKNKASLAIDPRIHGTGEEMQMVEALNIGYLCTADYPAKRPSMKQVIGLLKDIEPAAT